MAKIQKLKDAISDSGLKVLVHGPAGAGKTVLAATGGAPTLILSAEAGLLSLAGAPDHIDVVTIESMSDIGEMFDLLKEGTLYKWIVLDSVSEIAEVVLANEKAASKDARAAYGALFDNVSAMIRAFRDLPKYNVLMTAKQGRLEDTHTGITVYAPMLPGKQLTSNISYWFDEVFALRVEENEQGEIYRTLQTSRDLQFEAKDRSGKLDLFEKPSLKHIEEKIHA